MDNVPGASSFLLLFPINDVGAGASVVVHGSVAPSPLLGNKHGRINPPVTSMLSTTRALGLRRRGDRRALLGDEVGEGKENMALFDWGDVITASSVLTVFCLLFGGSEDRPAAAALPVLGKLMSPTVEGSLLVRVPRVFAAPLVLVATCAVWVVVS